jgi:hypothetical protein
MARNQSVQQQNEKKEVQEMKVEFVVSTEKKEVDPKMEELRKRRDTYKANLAYALVQQQKYAEDYKNAMVKQPVDQMEVDRLELKLREQDLRINFYKEKLAKVEEEIIRYKLERKAKEAVA